MTVLPDINVLLSLAWPNHQFHRKSTEWFKHRSKDKWLTCSTTELGFIRLSSNPAFTEEYVTAQIAADMLKKMKKHKGNFIKTSLPPSELDWKKIFGHRQVTDFFLLKMAIEQEAKLLTFDSGLFQLDERNVQLLKV